MPTQIYDFKALNELENIVIAKDATGRAERKVIDICAVVKEAGEVNTIHIKSQDKDLAKVNFKKIFKSFLIKKKSSEN